MLSLQTLRDDFHFSLRLCNCYSGLEASDGPQMAIGLKGHVLNPAFPEDYSNWQKTDLHELIDAELIKEPTDKNVVKAVRKVANDATSLVIATDFDREGELIGLEALQEILDEKPELSEDVNQGGADGIVVTFLDTVMNVAAAH